MFKKTMAALCIATLLAPAARADNLAATEAADEGEYAQALAMHRADAERGDPKAQEIVGLMLWFGDVLYGAQVPRDRIAAIEWLKRATAQGNQTARYMLATPAARRMDAADVAMLEDAPGEQR
jgi:TPR repeat protein